MEMHGNEYISYGEIHLLYTTNYVTNTGENIIHCMNRMQISLNADKQPNQADQRQMRLNEDMPFLWNKTKWNLVCFFQLYGNRKDEN